MGRAALAALAVLTALSACGEPPVDLNLPEREPGQVVLDQAGILDQPEVEGPFRAFDDRDVVALTYETEQASRGEARRAGQLLVEEWGADVALVAVARPGDFESTIVGREDPGDRRRFFGIEPADTFDVPGGLREEIVEERVPAIAADNDWQRVFVTAAEDLRAGLAERDAQGAGPGSSRANEDRGTGRPVPPGGARPGRAGVTAPAPRGRGAPARRHPRHDLPGIPKR